MGYGSDIIMSPLSTLVLESNVGKKNRKERIHYFTNFNFVGRIIQI